MTENKARLKDFSISNLQMMESTDGYAIRCDLIYKGKPLGVFFDRGDGSEYYFYPEAGHTQMEVETMLEGEDFPPIDEGFPGLPPIRWNIGILVEHLIERKDLDDRIAKAKKDGRDLVVITDEKAGYNYYVNFRSFAPDEAVAMFVKMNYGDKVKWMRY